VDIPVPLHTLVQYYADFLRQEFHLKKGTIASYISHVSKYLFENGHISSPTEIQSPRLTLQLSGYLKEDQENKTKRESIKIPVTFSILLEVIETICTLYLEGSIRQAYIATFCIGYALSLRPGEYLRVNPPVPLSHQANSSHAVFWFDDMPYYICFPELYPRGRFPDAFSLLIDHYKNDPAGNGGPRSIYANPLYDPTDPDSICCVREIFTFLSKHPPLQHSPLLSGMGQQISSSNINKILKMTAVRIGVDPSRLVPHSLRFGVLQQIEDADEETQLRQGNWNTIQGMRSYTRRSVMHARTITIALHAPSKCPLSHTLYMYATGAMHT
jgi:hypothetical protein